jgi:hypothetical protein
MGREGRGNPRRLNAKEIRQKIAAWHRRRAVNAEREVARHQKDCLRQTRKHLNSPKNIRLSTWGANLLDEIEHEHALMDPHGDQIKTSYISREEALRRNTSLSGSGYRWHLMRAMAVR